MVSSFITSNMQTDSVQKIIFKLKGFSESWTSFINDRKDFIVVILKHHFLNFSDYSE